MPEQYILITGAGSGLGRGLSLHFAAAGYGIIATDKSAESANATAAAAAGNVLAHALDVADAAAVAAFAETIADLAVAGLINNAGLQHVAPLESFPDEKWGELIDVMLKGAAAMSRLVLPGMRRRGYGRIVNIGSIHALVASPYKTAYVAAKHGLLGLSRVLALETADTDITVNTICPAYIRTPLVEAQIRDQARVHGISEAAVINEIMLEPMPKKSFISIEEIAGTIAFLLSPAARNMTGQALVLDGGWTCR